jgi:hypothetical protein
MSSTCTVTTPFLSFTNTEQHKPAGFGTYKNITLLPSTWKHLEAPGSTAMLMLFGEGHANRSAHSMWAHVRQVRTVAAGAADGKNYKECSLLEYDDDVLSM